MFVGHLAVALASKKAAPRVPLAALASAAFALDLLWPVFVLAGIETVRIAPGNTAWTPLDFVSYPWSHSLAMSLVWGAVAGHVARVWFKSYRAGVIVSALVVSHWVLDWISHRADMPLWPSGPTVGLGLWNSIPATYAVEGGLLFAGVAIYTRTTPARDLIGRWSLAAFIAVLTAVWATGPFTPPPPNPTAIAIAGLVFAAVMIPWQMWIERHRAVPAGP
jgi:hypothetical protein